MKNRWEKSRNSGRFYFLGLQNHCRWWLQPWNEKMLAPWKKSYEKPKRHIKKQRHHLVDKGPYNQNYSFSSSHVQIWELNHKEGGAPKNWCFQIVLEKTRESPLDCRSNQSILKEINPEYTPILWSPDAKSWLTGKNPHAGKDWGQEKKGATENEIVGWHRQLNGHEFEQILGDRGG